RNGWFHGNPYWNPVAPPYTTDPTAVLSVDAIWNSDGASCITVPRLLRERDPLAPDGGLSLWNDIMNECSLPGRVPHLFGTCTTDDELHWVDSYYAILFNSTSWLWSWL